MSACVRARSGDLIAHVGGLGWYRHDAAERRRIAVIR